MKLVMEDKIELCVFEQAIELLLYVRSIKVIGGEPLVMKKTL